MLLAGLVGAGLRLVDLGNRPMHADEAVQALRFARLLEKGIYQYNPTEFHGPVLPYFSLPVVWAFGAEDRTQLESWQLRLLPAAVGAVLVLGPWCLRRQLGRPATLAAAWLTALSPAMVFYSRYYIAEMVLVGFTWGAIAAWWGWRDWLRRLRIYPNEPLPLGPLFLLGICLGMMYATKETWVIPLVSMAAAGWLTLPPLRRTPKLRLLFGVGIIWAAGAAVWAALFSSGGLNPEGLTDSLKTYLHYFRQARGLGPGAEHIHPFWYYLQVLFAWKQPGGYWWSETAVLAFALAGGAAAVGRGRLLPVKPRQIPLARFLVVYTLIQALIYSAIPYKTPWCALGFYHGMLLLAGLGWAALWQWATPRSQRKESCSIKGIGDPPSEPIASPAAGEAGQTQARPGEGGKKPGLHHLPTLLTPFLLKKGVLLGILLLGGGHLAWQAHRASFQQVADPTQPYLYAPTTLEVDPLVAAVEQIVQRHPANRAVPIQVFFPDHQYWPLPWYLRRFSWVGWFGSFEEAERSRPAPVILAHPDMESGLVEYCYFRQPPGRRRLYITELGQGPMQWEIRPHAPIRLYVRWDFWEAWAEKRSGQQPPHEVTR